MQIFGAHCCEVKYFRCFGFRGELGFLNCDDICVCVVIKQFKLLKFIFDSVYVGLGQGLGGWVVLSLCLL